MKTTHTLLLITIICQLWVSCKKEKPLSDIPVLYIEKVYETNGEKLLLDSICSDIRIVPLETTEDILIRAINKICLHNDLLYVINNNGCSVFDLNGKFIRPIGKVGQGPGEYGVIADMIVTDNHVVLFQRSLSKLLFYSLEGEYITSFHDKEIQSIWKIAPLNDNIVCAFLENSRAQGKHKVVFINTKGELVDTVPYNLDYAPTDGYRDMKEGTLFKYSNELYLKEGYNDTVFKITSDYKLAPSYIIDGGGNALNYEKRYNRKRSAKESSLDGNTTIVLFENEHYIILDGQGLERKEYLLYNKEKGEINRVYFHYNEVLAQEFEQESGAFQPPMQPNRLFIEKQTTSGNSNNTVDLSNSAFRLMGVSNDNTTLLTSEISTKGNYDDNPVVVLVRMK